MGWATALQIGGSLLGAYGQYSGAKQQADQYKEIGKMFLGNEDKIAHQADPFLDYRSSYAKQLNDVLQGRRSITTDPGYMFTYNEGMRGTERAYAARGYNRSGNVLAALQQRGADIASQQYDTIINRLMTLSGANVNPAQAAQATTNVYQAAASALGSAGEASAGGTQSLLGGIGKGISSLGSLF